MQGIALKEILIIGHGLAGAVLSHSLLKKGQKVVVIEGKLPFSASSVAAGMVNPLIGPKLNPPPQISECLKEALAFYESFDPESAVNHFEEISLRRIFISPEQRELWEKRGKSSDSKVFTGASGTREQAESLGLDCPYGFGITKAYRLNVQAFLKHSKEVLKQKNLWFEERFDPKDWPSSHKVVFCEGYGVIHNPWFKQFPFEPAQGEVIRLQGPCHMPASNGTWYYPENEGLAYAGSTWNHDDIQCGPTERGMRTIVKNLSYLNFKKYKITDHASGIRSSTRDRHPILGRHPEISQYYVFNGFGSRGSTTIPFFAKQTVELLTKNKPISPQACLSRFQRQLT